MPHITITDTRMSSPKHRHKRHRSASRSPEKKHRSRSGHKSRSRSGGAKKRFDIGAWAKKHAKHRR